MLDAALARLRRPSRVDVAAEVHPSATITSSSLHGRVTVGERAVIHQAEISGEVEVGRFSSLWGPGIHVLTRIHPVRIGNFCSIARNVSVHGYGHDARRLSTHFIGRNVLGRPIEEELVSRGPTELGHDVWLGAGVHIMSGVSVGNGAVIGAGSVVTGDVPPYAVAVGAPARVTRFRFDDALIERIEALGWWEWSVDEIRAREALFTRPLTAELLDGLE